MLRTVFHFTFTQVSINKIFNSISVDIAKKKFKTDTFVGHLFLKSPLLPVTLLVIYKQKAAVSATKRWPFID